MTKEEINIIEEELRKHGQQLQRIYRAIEGDLRAIGIDIFGEEHRWFIKIINDEWFEIYEN